MLSCYVDMFATQQTVILSDAQSQSARAVARSSIDELPGLLSNLAMQYSQNNIHLSGAPHEYLDSIAESIYEKYGNLYHKYDLNITID